MRCVQFMYWECDWCVSRSIGGCTSTDKAVFCTRVPVIHQPCTELFYVCVCTQYILGTRLTQHATSQIKGLLARRVSGSVKAGVTRMLQLQRRRTRGWNVSPVSELSLHVLLAVSLDSFPPASFRPTFHLCSRCTTFRSSVTEVVVA